MKNKGLIFMAAMFLLLGSTAIAQNKVAFTDKAGFLTQAVESSLAERLRQDTLELTSMIDTRRRCEYWFATLTIENGNLLLSVLDCNDRNTGKKDLGSRILTASDSEKGLLIYFAFSDIIRNPEKYDSELKMAKAVDGQPVETAATTTAIDPGQHRSRYFFAPSAYNLEKGELYYNTIYFFMHDVQYGISERFSMGMGTTIMGMPFYLTPKITIPLADKSALGIGDMMMVGTFGTEFFGNLLYATYTRGGYQNNFSIGGGYLHTNSSDLTGYTNAFVFNFSSLLRASDHIFFITENYISSLKTKQTGSYYTYDPLTYQSTYFSEEFDQNVFFIFGLSGFRFINKTRDVKSWQFGLAYLFTISEEIPIKYKNANWSTSADQGARFMAFPAIGFARKFGTRY